MLVLPGMYGSGQQPAQGPGGPGHGGGGQQNRDTFKEGRIFVGGLNYATTKDGLRDYCSKWCVPSGFSGVALQETVSTTGQTTFTDPDAD